MPRVAIQHRCFTN